MAEHRLAMLRVRTIRTDDTRYYGYTRREKGRNSFFNKKVYS